MSDKLPQATIREIDGQLVLDDPAALEMIRAVEKHNCLGTLKLNADRIIHFCTRIVELKKSLDDVMIVILNVDDPRGSALADVLMPGFDWQAIRDAGAAPFARGLVSREGIQGVLDELDPEAAEKLRKISDEAAVLVMDRGVCEVFRSSEARD